MPRRSPRHQFQADVAAALQELSRDRKDRYGLLAALEDWSIILVAALMVLWPIHGGPIWSWAFLPLGWLIIGTRMRGLATLVHEASHNSLARTRWLGEVLGTFFSAWPILQLLGRYTRSHVGEHHRFLGDEVVDGDTVQYVKQELLQQTPNTFVVLNMLQLALGLKTLKQLPYLLRERLLPTDRSRLTERELRELCGFLVFWLVLLVTIFVNGWQLEFLLVWIIPYLTVFQAVGWLIETAEHFPLSFLEDQHIEMTRNRKGNALERFFFGIHGEQWHRVHHERPGIAFPRMREAHEMMMRDPVYRRGEEEVGGLLSRGPTGAPSVISQLPALLRKAQAALN